MSLRVPQEPLAAGSADSCQREFVASREDTVARQYAPKTFIRQARNSLLRRYLEERGVTSVPGEQLVGRSVETIYRHIENADQETRRQVDLDFRDIHALGTDGGTKTIIAEGKDRHHGVDLEESLSKMRSHRAKAFWTFLEHPEVFEAAKRFNYADCLPRWCKRANLPGYVPSVV